MKKRYLFIIFFMGMPAVWLRSIFHNFQYLVAIKNKRNQHKFKAYYLLAFLLLFSAKGFAQYFPAPAPVSPALEKHLLLELKGSTSTGEKIKTLLSLGSLYYNKPIQKAGDLDLALSKAAQARDLSTSSHDVANYNNAQWLAANILMLKDDLTSAEAILKDVNDSTKIKVALGLVYRYLYRPTSTPVEWVKGAKKNLKIANELSAKRHDKLSEILCLNFQALIDSHDDIKKTEKELNEVVRQYRSVGYTQRLQYLYYWLSIVYNYTGNFDKSFFYALESIKAMNSTRDTSAGGDFYFNLAVVYRHMKLHDKVIEASKTAITYFGAHAGERTIFDGIKSLNRELIEQNKYKEALSTLQGYLKKYTPVNYNDKKIVFGEYAECYLKLKNYAEAEKYYVSVFNMDRDSKSLDINSYDNLAFFYIETQNYAKAKPYLDKALEQLPLDNISVKQKIHLHFMAFLADSAVGQYRSAMNHLKVNSTLDHIVWDQLKTEAAQKFDKQFETEKKNHDIQMLTQKGLVQQSNLKQANLIKNITMAGTLIMIAVSALFYRNYRQKQAANKTITHKNELLQHLLTEKEWLLKEVHHRVKNNLHTVICLLESQAAYLEDDALKAIENGQHRIYAMSLIHQKLYQSDDIKTIDMATYIPELVQSLEDAFDVSNQIQFRLNIEPVHLNISHAIPIGLIINEAVTNSIKYAFPGNRNGEISILLIDDGDRIKLELADNGIGMSQINGEAGSGSLGLELMKGLSEDIDADIDFEVDNGTKITIKFKPDALTDTQVIIKSADTKEIYV